MNLSHEVNYLYNIHGTKAESRQCFSDCMELFGNYLEQLREQVRRTKEQNAGTCSSKEAPSEYPMVLSIVETAPLS